MGKSSKIITSSVLGTAAASALSAGTIFYIMSHRKGNTDFLWKEPAEEDKPEDMKRMEQMRKRDEEWFEAQENVVEYERMSEDGLRLKAKFLPAENSDGRYVLCVHGYRCTGIKEFACAARFYHEQGINVFLIDHRASGESEGTYITYGAKESRDCFDWLRFMIKEFGDDIKIILHGVSMGSATVMMMTGMMLPNNVSFAIADCGYATLKDQLVYNFNQNHMPAGLCYTMFKTMAKLVAKYNPDYVEPIYAVENSNIPILFAHGDADDFVPYNMVYALYDACPNPKKELLIVKGAEHAKCFYYSDELKEAIKKMMEKIL